ncbi:MAG: AIR synthase-related protein [Fidelibacterota bacterium]
MSRKTSINKLRPLEAYITTLLRKKSEKYSLGNAISEVLFPSIKPGEDLSMGTSGDSLFVAASRTISSKKSTRKLVYNSFAEAIMKLAVQGTIPESVYFCVKGVDNSVTQEAVNGALYFSNHLPYSSYSLEYSSVNTDSVVIIVIAEGKRRFTNLPSSTAVHRDHELLLFGAETDRRGLISPQELEVLSSGATILFEKPYVHALRYIIEGGIAVAAAELADSNGMGITIQENKVSPLLLNDPEKVLKSDSPGRCLVMISKSHKKEVLKLLTSFSLPSWEVGLTNSSGLLKIKHNKNIICSLDIEDLVFPHSAPRIHLMPIKKETVVDHIDTSLLKIPRYFKTCLKTLLSCPEVREEYHLLQQRVTSDNIAKIWTQSGDRFWRLDPRLGAILAVATAYRQLSVTGFTPTAMIIGVPSIEDTPDSLLNLRETLAGFHIAATDLGLEVLGRLFVPSENEPVVFVTGVEPDKKHILLPLFQKQDDFILILGSHRGELGGSTYLKEIHGKEEGSPPASDLIVEQRIQEILLLGAKVGLISSAAAVSRGGLAITLAHMLLLSADGIGARIHMSSRIRDDEILFGETQGLCVITVEEDAIMELERLCMRIGVTCTAIGRVTDKSIYSFNNLFSLKVSELKDIVG